MLTLRTQFGSWQFIVSVLHLQTVWWVGNTSGIRVNPEWILASQSRDAGNVSKADIRLGIGERR